MNKQELTALKERVAQDGFLYDVGVTPDDLDRLFIDDHWFREIKETQLATAGWGEVKGLADIYVEIMDVNHFVNSIEQLRVARDNMGELFLKLDNWALGLVQDVKQQARTIASKQSGRVNIRRVINGKLHNQSMREIERYDRTSTEMRPYKGLALNISLPWQINSVQNAIFERLKRAIPVSVEPYFIKFFSRSQACFRRKKTTVCILYNVVFKSDNPNREVANLFVKNFGGKCPNIITRMFTEVIGTTLTYPGEETENIRNLWRN